MYFFTALAENFCLITGNRINKPGKFSQKDNSSPLFLKYFQSFQRTASQGKTVRYKDCFIFHFPHRKRFIRKQSVIRSLAFPKRFGNKVKINQAKQQPLRQLFKSLIHFIPQPLGLFLVSPVKPVRFYRMNYANFYNCFSAV